MAFPGRLILGAGVILLCAALPASAQFLRVGTFDIYSRLKAELEYTTNVDGVRDSEKDEIEQKDLIYRAGITLSAGKTIGKGSSIRLSTGLEMERYVERTDLNQDTVGDPTGETRLLLENDYGRLKLAGFVSFKNVDEYEEPDVTNRTYRYTPGEFQQSDRVQTFKYGLISSYDYSFFSSLLNYDYTQERHQFDEFVPGDEDEELFRVKFRETLSRRIALIQSFEEIRTTQVALPDEPLTIERTTVIGAEYKILFKPSFRYTFAFEKEENSSTEQDEVWDPTHTWNLADLIDLTPRLDLAYAVSYSIEEEEEVDDVGFQYNIGLRHEINSSTRQGLRLSREPVDTFGSTTETDSTTYTYSLQKTDLFINALMLNVRIEYSIDKPVIGPEEKVWDYTVSLSRSIPINRRLARKWVYEYTYEESDLFPGDPTEEHNIVWTLTYDL